MEFETNFKCKKILSICLCLVLLFSMCNCVYAAAAVENNTNGKKITDYSVGDIVEFGWYPQSKVEDSSVIAELNSLAGDNSTWTSYGYYSGTGGYKKLSEFADGQMIAGDWMRYVDVIYNSDKYRGVVFDLFRPKWTGNLSTSKFLYTYQDGNNYDIGTVYWFLYEPIKWRVLDPSTGMVFSEAILDSQAFNDYMLYSDSNYWGDLSKTYYANDYEKSSIRQWLNDNFYNTAFSKAQQDIIEYTPLDNSAYSTSYSKYNSNATYDKIYLLSYSDVLNTSYGFNESSNADTARHAYSTAYAKSQGLYVYPGTDNSGWWLRSAGSYSNYTCQVASDNYISDGSLCFETGCGVRPVFNLNTTSDIFQTDINVNKVSDNDSKVGNANDSFSTGENNDSHSEKTTVIIYTVCAVIVVVVIVMVLFKKKNN